EFVRDQRSQRMVCPTCRTPIPNSVLETNAHLRTTVGVVGFSGHGKTVYLTSLFSLLKRFSNYWPGYYFRSLDDYTNRIIYEQVPRFEQGELPESTPANFPSPAMVHYHDLPRYGDAFVGYYDTAGEVFSESAQIARAGFFVAHSDVVLFIISIPDCKSASLDEEMCRLLDTYILAANDQLNANLKASQRMVVIFSKGDLLLDKMGHRLRDWLVDGGKDWYANTLEDRLADLSIASLWTEEWLADRMGCRRFLNMAKDHFKEVRFTVVSALGNEGEQGIDGLKPSPLRVLDPFLWLIDFASRDQAPPPPPPKKGFLRRIFRRRKKKDQPE
ncbi:MAG: hypothetical protein AAF570_28575, partial [Bacteroidota bacterium]